MDSPENDPWAHGWDGPSMVTVPGTEAWYNRFGWGEELVHAARLDELLAAQPQARPFHWGDVGASDDEALPVSMDAFEALDDVERARVLEHITNPDQVVVVRATDDGRAWVAIELTDEGGGSWMGRKAVFSPSVSSQRGRAAVRAYFAGEAPLPRPVAAIWAAYAVLLGPSSGPASLQGAIPRDEETQAAMRAGLEARCAQNRGLDGTAPELDMMLGRYWDERRYAEARGCLSIFEADRSRAVSWLRPRSELAELMVSDTSNSVRHSLAFCRSTADLHWVLDEDEEIRTAVLLKGGVRCVDPTLLERLARDPSEDVQRLIADNGELPVSVTQALLASSYPKIAHEARVRARMLPDATHPERLDGRCFMQGRGVCQNEAVVEAELVDGTIFPLCQEDRAAAELGPNTMCSQCRRNPIACRSEKDGGLVCAYCEWALWEYEHEGCRPVTAAELAAHLAGGTNR